MVNLYGFLTLMGFIVVLFAIMAILGKIWR
jgi:hypothetical protein